MSSVALRTRFHSLVPALSAWLLATAGAALLLAGSGYDVSLAFDALLQGAFGSTYALAETFVKTIPLLLTGLAVACAFRAGVWNIGAEGQLLIGALAAIAVAPWLPEQPALLGVALLFLTGALAGAGWGAIAGALKIHRNVPEVIATILLNFIAIEFVRYAVNGPLMENARQFPQTDAIAQSLRLVRLFPPARLHSGLIVALLLAGGTYLLFFRTALGWQMQMVAANPLAAHFAALNVNRVRFWSLALSGALAGLAGAVELSGITYRLYQNFSPGYGYTAIAVALMARLHPLTLIGTALLFAALENGAAAMQRQANVSAVIVYAMQGMVIVAVAVIGAWQLKRTGS